MSSFEHIPERNFDSPVMVDFFGKQHLGSMTATAEVQLLGPRPGVLEVNKGSATITKHVARPRDRSSPVVVYLQPPEVVHVRPEDFMEKVQLLTGNRSAVPAGSSDSFIPTSVR